MPWLEVLLAWLLVSIVTGLIVGPWLKRASR